MAVSLTHTPRTNTHTQTVRSENCFPLDGFGRWAKQRNPCNLSITNWSDGSQFYLIAGCGLFAFIWLRLKCIGIFFFFWDGFASSIAQQHFDAVVFFFQTPVWRFNTGFYFCFSVESYASTKLSQKKKNIRAKLRAFRILSFEMECCVRNWISVRPPPNYMWIPFLAQQNNNFSKLYFCSEKKKHRVKQQPPDGKWKFTIHDWRI